MSIFNMVVKPHIAAPFLLRTINWAQPDDPEKKYPLLGRVRYVWMSEDMEHVKILLKDGPASWSEQKEELMNQIKNHESFVSLETLKRDECYLVASFKPLEELSHDKEFPIKDFFFLLKEKEESINLDQEIKKAAGLPYEPEDGIHSITKDPFILFEEEMEKIKNGHIKPEIANIVESFADVINQTIAEDEIKKMANESGIDMKGTGPRIFSINSDGTMKDQTDEFDKEK